MTSSYFEDGRFRWGINLDDMWLYAGLPQPRNFGAKGLLTKKVRGSLEGIFHRNKKEKPSSSLVDYSPRSPHLWQKAREAISRLAGDLKIARMDYVRCWFQWNFFEPDLESESYQFPLDDFVSTLRSEGIEIVAVLGSGYSRFLPNGTDQDDSVAYLSALDYASRAIVRHYSNSINIWQIENEPNWWPGHIASGWRQGMIWETSGFHDAIMETLHRIIKEENPSASIVVNLEADRKGSDWKIYTKFCDVLGLDFYPNYSKPVPIDVSTFDLASEIKAKTGMPLFIAETGYPSGPIYEGYSEHNQQMYITSAAQKAFSLDALSGISIWRFSDSTWKSVPKQQNHFGLRRENGMPKPAWSKYAGEICKFKSRSDPQRVISNHSR